MAWRSADPERRRKQHQIILKGIVLLLALPFAYYLFVSYLPEENLKNLGIFIGIVQTVIFYWMGISLYHLRD